MFQDKTAGHTMMYLQELMTFMKSSRHHRPLHNTRSLAYSSKSCHSGQIALRRNKATLSYLLITSPSNPWSFETIHSRSVRPIDHKPR